MSTGLGYWEPHSSSIDFCEPNYLVTEYIAEFHNTWSSTLITILAVIGFFYGNPTNEKRFSILYIILGTVGVGSTALHCTLNWFPQSSDEVPMLWTVLSLLYSLVVMQGDMYSPRNSAIGLAFTCWAIIQTLIYYKFQQVYASFIVTFLLSALIVAIWTAVLAFGETDPKNRPIRVSLWVQGFTSFAVMGAAVWVADMHLCHYLMPYYLSLGTGGLTLHVVWHIVSAIGTYYTILFLTVIRMQHLKQDPVLEYVYGIVPVCKPPSKLI